MNASRFTELLNLYIDQELSAAEASELEVEIARDPDRRRTYEQYCRMQRACTMLFESSRAQAPASGKLALAARAADEKVLTFPTSLVRPSLLRSRTVWGACIGAAAACVATVLVLREPSIDGGPIQGNPGMVQTAPAATPHHPDAHPGVTLPGSRSQPAPVRPSRPSDFQLAASFSPQARDSAAIFTPADTTGVSLEWMNRVEHPTLPRISADTLRFAPDRDAGDRSTTIRSWPVHLQSEEEFNAFEFRR